MSEQKFKVGDWAWSPFEGFQIVRIIESLDKLSEIVEHGDRRYYCDGKWNFGDLYPTLLTEAEANKFGYFREPEKPKLVQYYQGVYVFDETWMFSKRLYKNIESFRAQFDSQDFSHHKLLPAKPDFLLEDAGE